jgi:hypothetical protein
VRALQGEAVVWGAAAYCSDLRGQVAQLEALLAHEQRASRLAGLLASQMPALQAWAEQQVRLAGGRRVKGGGRRGGGRAAAMDGRKGWQQAAGTIPHLVARGGGGSCHARPLTSDAAPPHAAPGSARRRSMRRRWVG